jgi:hypothetical protein
MEASNSSEELIPTRMKVCNLMDCEPGNADSPQGEAVTILHFAHGADIEEPIMIDLRDTENLVVKLLVSLATAGDEFAGYLLDEYFDAESGSEEEDDAEELGEFFEHKPAEDNEQEDDDVPPWAAA